MAVSESKEHRTCRHALRDLEARIRGTQKVHFTDRELRRAKIHVEKVSFEEDPPTFSPRYLIPYPAHLLPDPDLFSDPNVFPDEPDDYALAYPEYDCDPMPELRTKIECARRIGSYLSHYGTNSELFLEDRGLLTTHPTGPWCYRDQVDYTTMKLLEEFPPRKPTEDEPHWYATSLLHVSDHDCSHMNASMIYNIDGDERILRGELLALIRIMEGRLNVATLAEHVLVPVILFSYMAPQHGRILQGVFDGKKLIVYQSKLYDFRREKDAPIKLFTSWDMCNITGDTRSLPSQETAQESSN